MNLTLFSEEWLRDLAARAATIRLDDVSTSVVIQQHVGDQSWFATISAGGLCVTPGVAHRADVTLTQSLVTATAIARGKLSSQQCFIDGRVQLDGDADALIAARPWFAALDQIAPDQIAPATAQATGPDADPSVA